MVAGADVAGDDGGRADIEGEGAGERDPEEQGADADGGEPVGADVVADEGGIDGAQDGDREALDDDGPRELQDGAGDAMPDGGSTVPTAGGTTTVASADNASLAGKAPEIGARQRNTSAPEGRSNVRVDVVSDGLGATGAASRTAASQTTA